MGFDNECIVNIESLPGEYFCPVCRTLIYPNEALQAACTHLYCKPCLSYTVATTQACPYDGYLVTEADSKPLREVNKGLTDAIGKVQVHCLYYRSSCPWQGSLSDCMVHCATCMYGNSPVVCNRCSTQIVHRQVQDHAQVCPVVQTQASEPAVEQVQAPPPHPQATTAAPGGPGLQGATAANQADEWYQQQQQYYQQQQQYPGYDPYAQYPPQAQPHAAPPQQIQNAQAQPVSGYQSYPQAPPAPYQAPPPQQPALQYAPPQQPPYRPPPQQSLPAQQFLAGPPEKEAAAAVRKEDKNTAPPSSYGGYPPPPYAAPAPSYPAPARPNGVPPHGPPSYPRPAPPFDDPYLTSRPPPPFYPSEFGGGPPPSRFGPPEYDRPPFNGGGPSPIKGNVGWCRICKVDCGMLQGLDHHSQSKDHQNKSMDMLLAIKHRLSKKTKLSLERDNRSDKVVDLGRSSRN